MPRPPMKARTALYRLFSVNDVLLYVGISWRPEVRFADHARYKKWWPEVTNHQIEWFENRLRAEHAERHAIKTECPLHNNVFTPRHQPWRGGSTPARRRASTTG